MFHLLPAVYNILDGFRELLLFVESGFSEAEALQAATIHAANALGRKDIGRIQENTLADLVVLKGNPLQNIEQTQAIDFVIKGGKCMDYDTIFPQLMSTEEQQAFQKELLCKFEQYDAAHDPSKSI